MRQEGVLGVKPRTQGAGIASLPFGSLGLFFNSRNDNFVAIERGNDGFIIQINAEGSRPGLRYRELEANGARAALIGDQIKLPYFFSFGYFLHFVHFLFLRRRNKFI